MEIFLEVLIFLLQIWKLIQYLLRIVVIFGKGLFLIQNIKELAFGLEIHQTIQVMNALIIHFWSLIHATHHQQLFQNHSMHSTHSLHQIL